MAQAPVEDSKGIPHLVAALLAQRGICSERDVDIYLNPTLDQLPSPDGLLGLDKAVDILENALAKRIPVLVYGDYDADGITATALLLSFFKEIGITTCFYIPDRLTEGYGLHAESLRRLRSGVDLAGSATPVLVTVDCGITNHAEVAEARRLGFSVIITDHHQPPPLLPEAEAIINPHQPECEFAYKTLAGVGVAFYLAAGLRTRLVARNHWRKGALPNLKKYLDLVAIGSVADMVPMTGANRLLVKAGLEVIAAGNRPGLQAMLDRAGISAAGVNSGIIGFQLAPRINAAGRVGDPRLAVQILLSDKDDNLKRAIEELENANQLRKDLADQVFKEASLQAKEQWAEGRHTLVLVGEGWHPGVIGLAASRLANLYCRPAVVIVVDDNSGHGKGSVRSVSGMDIYKIMVECSPFLEKYGGHQAAGGLTIKKDNIGCFSKKFESSVKRTMTGKLLQPTLRVNLKASLDELFGQEFLEYYAKFEPFGAENPEPVFNSRNGLIKLTNPRKIGVDALRFQVAINGGHVDGVGFGMAHFLSAAEKGAVEMAFRVVLNEFRGISKWEIRADDIKTL